MRRAVICVALLLCGAATEVKGATLLGAGNMTCGRYTQHRKEESPAAFLAVQWVLGWVTRGVVQRNRDLLEGLDGEAVSAWMDNRCKDHPLVRMIDVATAFEIELSER